MTTIAQERAGLAKVGRNLRTREQAGFTFDYTTPRSVEEPATRVFIHISVTNPRNYSSDDAHARAIEAIGRARFPATGCSYNRLHMQSGTAYEGQPIGRRGAHTVNDRRRSTCTTTGCPGKGASLTAPSWNLNINARSYAICQNVADAVTDAQLDSLARSIAADMLAGFVRRDARIHGHRCVAQKDCPAEKMWARMTELRDLVSRYVRSGLLGGAAGGGPATPIPEHPLFVGTLNKVIRWERGEGPEPDEWERKHVAKVRGAMAVLLHSKGVTAFSELRAVVNQYQNVLKLTNRSGWVTPETVVQLKNRHGFVPWDGHPRHDNAIQ